MWLVPASGTPAIALASIVNGAFNPQALGGGIIGVMLIGVSRGAFSNEAGVGTEVMAHGAARTSDVTLAVIDAIGDSGVDTVS